MESHGKCCHPRLIGVHLAASVSSRSGCMISSSDFLEERGGSPGLRRIRGSLAMAS